MWCAATPKVEDLMRFESAKYLTNKWLNGEVRQAIVNSYLEFSLDWPMALIANVVKSSPQRGYRDKS